jgi:hypothetical protein
VVRTKPFRETWDDFRTGWKNARRQVGQSFAVAARVAKTNPMPAIVHQKGYKGRKAQLVALCWQLALQWQPKPFPLGCEKAAEYLGVSKQCANKLLRRLECEAVLVMATDYDKPNRMAREWFIGTVEATDSVDMSGKRSAKTNSTEPLKRVRQQLPQCKMKAHKDLAIFC